MSQHLSQESTPSDALWGRYPVLKALGIAVLVAAALVLVVGFLLLPVRPA